MTDTDDPTDLDAVEQRDAKRTRQAITAARAERDDLVYVMRSKQGRRVFRRLLATCGVPDGDVFSTNALVMARYAGMRLIGTQLAQQLKAACFDSYILMQQEEENDRRQSAGNKPS